jgi:hypothetical protein
MPIAPFSRKILDAVIPPTARWIVAIMRRIEEAVPDPAARWEILRKRLEGIGRQ